MLMKNKLNQVIVVAVVTLVIIVSGCVTSDVSNINAQATNINNHVKNGDHYYNESASNTNKYLLAQALTEENNASTEYNQAQTAAQAAYNSAQDSNDAIFVEYLQNILYEVQAKLNATSELKTAITDLENNDTSDANDHLATANNYMNNALTYENNSENIVNQNPSKFQQ
ncbi:MAG: hypothetical protein ACLPWD_03930 [Methanobacterium sp.]